jgi:hypothetical protein
MDRNIDRNTDYNTDYNTDRKLLSIRPAGRLTCLWLPSNDPRSPLTCVWQPARSTRPATPSVSKEEILRSSSAPQGGKRCA